MKIAADIIWSNQQLYLQQSIEFKDGQVLGIDAQEEVDLHFPNCAIVPGFANAHSHSFQRVIRGKTEWITQGHHDDFWSWRNAMYRAVNRLNPQSIEAIAEWTFLEMLKAGVTAVGEFHYLHHQPNGQHYLQVSELSDRVMEAARRVGIRLTHLPVAYSRGGHRQPLVNAQKRFIFHKPAHFLKMVDDLRRKWDDHETISVGLAPHSVRAVDRRWLQACAEAANDWQAPLHIHACEQERELQECAEEHQRSPIQLMSDVGLLNQRTTLIHATHLDETDLQLIQGANAMVCGCPTTEGNLGDGFLPAVALLEHDVRLCFGTDSHAQIDLFQEARLTEMQQRLQRKRRNILAHFSRRKNAVHRTADVIWPMLTQFGYGSLGLKGGALSVGEPADFLVIDLEHPSLYGVKPEDLLDTLILSGQNESIKHVYVHGRAVLQDGKSQEESRIRAAYIAALSALEHS